MMWEYAVTFVAGPEGDQEKKLLWYGERGWELVSVAGSYAYFKRMKAHQ